MAASAIFALNAGVWFRRGRLLIVSPDSQAIACLPSGRNSTYRPVQISGTGSNHKQGSALCRARSCTIFFISLIDNGQGPISMKIFVPTAAECKLVTIYDTCITAFREHNANRGVSWVSDPRAADIIVL